MKGTNKYLSYEELIKELNKTSWIKKIWYSIVNFFRRKIHAYKNKQYLIKYGYTYDDVWNIDHWFLKTVKNILIDFNEAHTGYPVDMTEEEWNNIIREMIAHLTIMNSHKEVDLFDNDAIEEEKKFKEMHKEEFFKLFSKYFYQLWD